MTHKNVDPPLRCYLLFLNIYLFVYGLLIMMASQLWSKGLVAL